MEDSIEIDYNFKEREYTVVAASKLRTDDQYYIQSVVIIDSLRGREKAIEIVPSAKSAKGRLFARSRSFRSDRRDMSPTNKRRFSALDRQRSLSRRPLQQEEKNRVRDSSISARRLRLELLDSDCHHHQRADSFRSISSTGSSSSSRPPIPSPKRRFSALDRHRSLSTASLSLSRRSRSISKANKIRGRDSSRDENNRGGEYCISEEEQQPEKPNNPVGGRFLKRVRSIPRTRSKLMKLAAPVH